MNEMQQIGARLKELRESREILPADLAYELHIDVDTYNKWEETGEDVPISALYHLAKKFKVEFNEILTGEAEKLRTFQIVRAGEGIETDRYPGYIYEDLAWRFSGKMMQPLLVRLDPSDEPAKIVSHSGQEFNYVVEGTVILNWGEKEFVLNTGDSIYFNPTMPHAQRCGGNVPAKFVTVIAE